MVCHSVALPPASLKPHAVLHLLHVRGLLLTLAVSCSPPSLRAHIRLMRAFCIDAVCVCRVCVCLPCVCVCRACLAPRPMVCCHRPCSSRTHGSCTPLLSLSSCLWSSWSSTFSFELTNVSTRALFHTELKSGAETAPNQPALLRKPNTTRESKGERWKERMGGVQKKFWSEHTTGTRSRDGVSHTPRQHAAHTKSSYTHTTLRTPASPGAPTPSSSTRAQKRHCRDNCTASGGGTRRQREC